MLRLTELTTLRYAVRARAVGGGVRSGDAVWGDGGASEWEAMEHVLPVAAYHAQRCGLERKRVAGLLGFAAIAAANIYVVFVGQVPCIERVRESLPLLSMFGTTGAVAALVFPG